MDQDSKDKHSKRIYQKETQIARQMKIAKAHRFPVKAPHKLSKMSAVDCGDPNCVMCTNPRKAFNEDTIQEKSFKQTESWND
jgi:hypothetical protein